MDNIRQSRLSWDELWLDVALLVSTRSKDPRTRVGAVLVSPDNRQQSVGYNGFPSGLPDLEDIWRNRDPADHNSKYSLVIHAEENALLNCHMRPSGWTLYCNYAPCLRCACRLVQAGVSRVVYLEEIVGSPSLETSRALDVLKMSGIATHQVHKESHHEPGVHPRWPGR